MNEESKELPVAHDTEDWFLQRFVHMANKDLFETGITLTVGGLQISGMLISAKNYFKELGDLFASGWTVNDEVSKASIAQSVAAHGTSGDDDDAPAYIHLRAAKFFGPNGQALANDEGYLWRGRLSEVSGFLLGSHNKPK